MSTDRKFPFVSCFLLASAGVLGVVSTQAHAEGAGFDAEVVVVAPMPHAQGLGLSPERLPFIAQSTDADAIRRSQTLDLSEHLATSLGSVSVNSTQGNPLQQDLQFRGYTASPLVGLPMGISVFVDGVRVNEPLGDAVNWDLVPESAIASATMVSGSNPLFGLNTLGGALNLELKNGFSYQGREIEVAGGSWGRVTTSAQAGGNNGTFGYYVNVASFDEEGWREQSPSDSLNVYGSLSWRQEGSAANLSMHYADSNLIGNGPAPMGLMQVDRSAVFTTPDITGNNLRAETFDFSHAFTPRVQLMGNAFHRELDTSSFNGDTSPFARCALGAGNFLIDGLEGDDLAPLGLSEQDVCSNNSLGVANPAALRTALRALAGEPKAFRIRDLTPTLTGNGTLSAEAINNLSERGTEVWGGGLQSVLKPMLFQQEHYLVVGADHYHGATRFDARVELADLDPVTRSTAGLGTGVFVGSEATQVATMTETWGLYVLDNVPLTSALTLTAGGRWNHTEVRLRDRSGARPELNGDHGFQRFNPTVGLTFAMRKEAGLYASYSESARAPTPVELACNDGVFDQAQQLAAAQGRDPEDANFECRLPNAFLTDPPLKQVVATSIEAGVRGVLMDSVEQRLGYFRTINHDDIIFQSTGRSTGLFANVERTKREGMELALAGSVVGIDWSASYSYVRATFDSPFEALSPNHPAANEAGVVHVRAGDRLPGVPTHQLKLGLDRHFARGFAVGVDLIANGDQVLRGDESNQVKPVGAWAVVNLRGSWQINPNMEGFARVTNLFDTDYENFGILGESPAEVLPALANPSNRFFGVGAPRAGWVGLRFSF